MDGKVLLEISSPDLALDQSLFVTALPEIAEQASQLAKTARVGVSFDGRRYSVPYLLILTLFRDEAHQQLRQIGELEQTESINILNHIVDVLAYPAARRF